MITMSELERAFITTSDATWKKVEGKDGQTYHFKDGTPKSQNAFNAATQHVKHEGEPASIAIPSNKGPGYERIEVSQQEASRLGQELAHFQEETYRDPTETIQIGDTEYSTKELRELNERIVDRHGPDAVMKY